MEIEAVREGVSEEKAGFPRQYGPTRTDHQPGVPFWPHEVYRDLVIIFVLCAIVLFLSAAYTPIVGPSANPSIQPFIVPDWYLLFSWGLLKSADIFPAGFTIPDGLGGKIFVDAAFWGDVLTAIPIIPLFLLPFLDRGRESRPAKRLARSFADPHAWPLVFFLAVIVAYSAIVFFATAALREKKAKEVVLVTSIATFFLVVAAVRAFASTDGAGTYSALQQIGLYGNFLIALPLFSLLTFYMGTRTPYST